MLYGCITSNKDKKITKSASREKLWKNYFIGPLPHGSKTHICKMSIFLLSFRKILLAVEERLIPRLLLGAILSG